MNHRRRISFGLAAGVMASALVGTMVIDLSHVDAAAPTSYSMTASANTFDVEVDAANFPLLAPQAAFASVSSAQAMLDSFGGSTAFAGAPFLGQTVEGAGGLVSGLGSGVLPPIPQTLPGYVASSNPSVPTDSASQGPYTLSATSGDTQSGAVAGIVISSQPTVLSSTATATTSQSASGALQSKAQSTTQPIALGNVVQIGTVQASATESVDDNGVQTQMSSFDFGSITIGGIKVGLTQSGIALLGSTLKTPSIAILNTLLSSSGISLALLPSTKTATSITSEGIQIKLSKNLPVEGASAIILTLGQATAELNTQALPNAEASGPTDITPTTDNPVVGSSGSLPSGAAPTTDLTGGDTSQTPTTAASPGASTSPLSPLASQVQYRFIGRLEPDGLLFYLVLVLVALALLAASRAAGALAVRRSGTKGSA